MTFPDDSDRALRQLQILTPDPTRTTRVRARCRTRLARARSRAVPAPPEAGFAGRILAPAAIGCLCALYLVSLLTNLLRLTRAF